MHGQDGRADRADVIGGNVVSTGRVMRTLPRWSPMMSRGTEAKGFQVSVTGPSGTNLIGDSSTLQEAEAFADQMRVIDADRSYSTPAPPPEST